TCSANSISFEMGGANTCLGTSFFPNGQGWHHYAVRKTGTTIEIFIDGSLVSTGSVGGSHLGSTTNDVYLGQWLSPGQNWQGAIDEVQIYPRALSTVQIAQLCNDGDSDGDCSDGIDVGQGLGGPTVLHPEETSSGDIVHLSVTPIALDGG